MLKFLDLKAIGFGVLANLALSFILSLIASILAMIVFSTQGLSVEDMDARLARPWEYMPVYIFLLLVGAACDYGAGMVTAHVAVRLEYYQTFAMMLVMVMISFLMGPGEMPMTHYLISILVGLGAAFGGAYKIKSRKVTAQSS